jgi:hypothetical protein
MLQIKDIMIGWSGRLAQKQASYLASLQLPPKQLAQLKAYIKSVGGGNDAFELLKRKETKTEFETFLVGFAVNLKMNDKEKAKEQILTSVERIIAGEADEEGTVVEQTELNSESEETFLDSKHFSSDLYERCLDYLAEHFSLEDIEEFKAYTVSTFENHMNNNNQSHIYKKIVEDYRNH